MTSKVLAALLALAVSMAANAPGRLPAPGPRSFATAGTNSHDHQIASAAEPGRVPVDAGFDIAEWLGRAEEKMNAGRSAWSQFDFSTLDLPIEAWSRFSGERTADPSRTLFASESFESFESFDNPELRVRLAAL